MSQIQYYWFHSMGTFFYNICTCEPRNEVYFVYKALSSHRYGTLGKTTYSWRLQKYFQARSTSFNILWSCTQRCKVYKYLLGKKENYLIWICRFKCWKTILISILFLILQWMKKGCSVQTMHSSETLLRIWLLGSNKDLVSKGQYFKFNLILSFVDVIRLQMHSGKTN